MTRSTQIVWLDGEGQELLRMKTSGSFYIVPSTVDFKSMRELRDALTDALSDELVQAINTTQQTAP
jgi:hypothetical protein